jgi:hypothetical protein
MRLAIVCLLVIALPSVVAAASFPQGIAFEFQEKGRFMGVIGKAELTEKALEIVTFIEQDGNAIPFSYYNFIVSISEPVKNIFIVECQNPLGVIFEGTIDLRDRLHPLIKLTAENGVTITNISEGGKKLKQKLIPKVFLGL